MWMSVDRIEGLRVVLVDDAHNTHELNVADYVSLVGQPPQETHMLLCQITNEKITSATFSQEETDRRLAIAKARFERLMNRKPY